MDFFEAIEARRSVRKFKSQNVPEEQIRKAIDAALLAPNSSNMQPWEFYWVRSPEKKAKLVEACFSQPAAATSAELIVCVSRIDTWKRNQKLMLAELGKAPAGKVPESAWMYYRKLVPMMYWKDPVGIVGVLQAIVFTLIGFFRPVPRGPYGRGALFNMVTKTTALACENLMLALSAQGLGSCPMEGFDERVVKKLLRLGRNTQVVMVVGTGFTDPAGVFGPRIRFDSKLFVHEV